MTIQAANDLGSLIEDGPKSEFAGNVLLNDSSSAGGLTVFAIAGLASNVGQLITGKYGTVRINADGTYVYTYLPVPASQALGVGEEGIDLFSYTARNSVGEQSLATLKITIAGTNDTPTGVADSSSTGSAAVGMASGNLLANDYDVDGDVDLVVTSAGGVLTTSGVVEGIFGTLTFNRDGSYIYKIDHMNAARRLHEGEAGTDIFTYNVLDPNGASGTGTLTVSVLGFDQAPTTTVISSSSSTNNPGQFVIAELADGSSVLYAFDTAISKQSIDRDGHLVGVPTVINGSPEFRGGTVGVEILTGGNHVLFWPANGATAKFQLFNNAGASIGSLKSVSSLSSSPAPIDLSIEALGSGGFVAAWAEDNYGSSKPIRFQVFDSTGNTTGSLQTVTSVGSYGGPARAVSTGANTFAVLWVDSQAWDAPKFLKMQMYDGLGNQTSGTLSIGTVNSSQIDVKQLAAGKILIFWQDGRDVFAKTVDTVSGVASDAFRLVGDQVHMERGLTISATPDGGFIASWQVSENNYPTAHAIRAQLFNGDGKPVGGSFEVATLALLNGNPIGSLGRVTVEALDGNRVLFAWQQSLGNPSTLETRLISYGANDEVLSGTSSGDLVDGRFGSDRIEGFGGNDRLFGGAGDDVILGGSGADFLAGQDGHDRLEGGIGDDVLKGGEGNDVVVGGTGRDVIDGGAGEDALVLQGSLNSYAVTREGDGWRVTSARDSDFVKGVEQVVLNGTSMSWGGFTTNAFDGLRYIASNPDLIVTLGVNTEAARKHYLDHGKDAGRSLTAFNPFLYAASNPDLLKAFGPDLEALTTHYIQFGITEGRSTSTFSAARYAAANTDVLGAYGFDPLALVAHFAEFGFSEGRPSVGFDALLYAASNPDLAAVFGADEQALLRHYVESGFNEGRATTGFNALLYAASNPDLAVAFGLDQQALLHHYVGWGVDEGRATTGFNALLYAASNPDLATVFGTDQQSLLHHYVGWGIEEGRATSGFDALLYAASNPDVAAVFGTDQQSLLHHYVGWGINEGRPTHGFDGVAYLINNPDLGEAGLDASLALYHWIQHGIAEGRTGNGAFGTDQDGHMLEVGTDLQGIFGASDDLDWYSLDLVINQSVHIVLDEGAGNRFLRVYDHFGHLLAFDEDTGDDDDASLTFSPSDDGKYFVVVGSTGAPESYTLSADYFV